MVDAGGETTQRKFIIQLLAQEQMGWTSASDQGNEKGCPLSHFLTSLQSSLSTGWNNGAWSSWEEVWEFPESVPFWILGTN